MIPRKKIFNEKVFTNLEICYTIKKVYIRRKVMKKVKPNFNKLIAIICAVLVAVLVGGFSIGSTVVLKTKICYNA